jgi:hypothetical protein
VQYIGKVNPYSLVTGVKGYFDGDSGSLTRQWSLGTANGLTSIEVANNVSTVTTSYTHGVHVGDHVSVWNTTSASLNKDGISGDYTVTGATPTTFTFSTSGVSSGTYTYNLHCGPGVTPNGTIQGADNCVRISQRAVTTNLAWARLFNTVSALGPPTWKFLVDGGNQSSTGATSLWVDNAVVFMVDQANHSQGISGSNYLDAVLYGLGNIEKIDGSTFIVNEAALDGGNYAMSGYGNDVSPRDLAVVLGVGMPFQASASRTTTVNKLVSDIGDPNPCKKTLAVPHDTLATGTAQAGGSTWITLASSDIHATGYYVNNIVATTVGGAESDGLVTSYDGSTKVATVASW